MKGIILAGGTGSRLYPLTQSVNKQLLPVYDVPLIYYPMATLMNAGIREICIISSPDYIPAYKKLFFNGRHLGLDITYEIQEKPEGIAQAFIIGKDFIGNDPVMLVLGDNIFHGKIDYTFFSGAKIFAYEVSNPQDYGVVNFDSEGKATMLVEKPKEFISKFAIPGLYIYDNEVIDIAKNLKPSERGELEITDLNKEYLNNNRLYVSKLDRGFVWLDAGVPSTLHQASSYVETIQSRQGIKIACLEEIALNKHFINKIEFVNLLNRLPNSEYKKYLTEILSTRLIFE
jgi:glucose-1-phosphate thymidylyltransferase